MIINTLQDLEVLQGVSQHHILRLPEEYELRQP